MEWINIDERKPGTDPVLVVDEYGQILTGEYEVRHDGSCWRIGNGNVLWDHNFNIGYNVTH